MRKVILTTILLGCAGSAAAGERWDRELRHALSAEPVTQVFIRLDFSAHRARPAVGFQVFDPRAQALGAPALLRAEFGPDGSARLALNGVDLSRHVPVARQSEAVVATELTLGELITVIAAVAAVAGGTYSALEDDEPAPAPDGTGSP